MARTIGVLLLGIAAWLGWRGQAQAATGGAATAPLPSSPDAAPVAAVPAGPAYYLQLVRQINADQFGGFFEPALIMGIMQTESSFDPLAYRYEPSVNDASYGLMQILFRTAQDRGFTGDPGGLYDPATNISLGMAQLKWSYDYLTSRLGTISEEQWLSSYNNGVGNVVRGKIRLSYVTKVRRYRDGWRKSGVA